MWNKKATLKEEENFIIGQNYLLGGISERPNMRLI